MARKIKITMPDGKTVEGTDLSVTDSKEPWGELHLEDGTVMRIKTVVASVTRVDGQFDGDGNPVYVVKAVPAVSIVDVPDALRKKG